MNHFFSSRRGLSLQRVPVEPEGPPRGPYASRAFELRAGPARVKWAAALIVIASSLPIEATAEPPELDPSGQCSGSVSMCPTSAVPWCPDRGEARRAAAVAARPWAPGWSGAEVSCVEAPLCTPDLVEPGPGAVTWRRRDARAPKPRVDALVRTGPARAVGARPRGWRLLSFATVDEGETLEFRVEAPHRGPEVFALDLPPGARFEGDRFGWTPDFIQGGRAYVVRFVAPRSGDEHATTIVVRDTVRPPAPRVIARAPIPDGVELTVEQVTDTFLDSPGYAGRRFRARVVIPKEGGRAAHPVQVVLHGFNGRPEPGLAEGQIRIHPHDPRNTYWWGYASTLPGPPRASAPNYTQRRVLHLLQWVLKTQPTADPQRVYVSGESMGGAGALALGLLYARHFALVEATIGQTVARNHRPSRVAQLSRLWGSPQANLTADGRVEALGVWDRLDLVRALGDDPEARDQFVFMHHGKDDPIIHFGAVVQPSPKYYGLSFYDALQHFRVGHFVVWDEGGHGTPDPVLGEAWWEDGWDRIGDPVTYLRRDLAFVAFSSSSADDDPGDGGGNGRRPFDAERGYAGRRARPGDTGWAGDVAGARNRYLRWDSRRIVDRPLRFEIPLGVSAGPGAPPPRTNYPPRGGRLAVDLPIRVDVTPRRLQAFQIRPSETIAWRFRDREGVARADAHGDVVIEALELNERFETLVLTRSGVQTSAHPAP